MVLALTTRVIQTQTTRNAAKAMGPLMSRPPSDKTVGDDDGDGVANNDINEVSDDGGDTDVG